MGFSRVWADLRGGWRPRLAALAAAMLLNPALAAQLDVRWFGTWAFNPARSIVRGGDAPLRKAFLKIAPSGESVTIIYDLFRERGGVTHLEWTGQFDGRDYPLQGVDQYSVTNAYRRLDDRSYEIVQKVDGAISSTASISLAPDGKTLTTITRGKNAVGEDVTATTVYEKR